MAHWRTEAAQVLLPAAPPLRRPPIRIETAKPGHLLTRSATLRPSCPHLDSDRTFFELGPPELDLRSELALCEFEHSLSRMCKAGT